MHFLSFLDDPYRMLEISALTVAFKTWLRWEQEIGAKRRRSKKRGRVEEEEVAAEAGGCNWNTVEAGFQVHL